MRSRVRLLIVFLLLIPARLGFAQTGGNTKTPSDLEEARAILRRAMDSAATIQNPFDRSDVMARIAGLMIMTGDTKSAEDILHSLPILKDVVNDSNPCRIAAGFAMWGDFTRGYSAALSISDEDSKNECLIRIGSIQAKAGDVSIGTHAALNLRDPFLRSYYLAQVAGGAASGKHWDLSRETYRLSLEAAESIQDEDKRLRQLGEIANQRAFVDPEGALGMVPHLMEGIVLISDKEFKDTLVGSVVNVQMLAGKFDEAIQMTRLAGTKEFQKSLLIMINGWRLADGDFASTSNWLPQIQDQDVRDQILLETAKARARAGEISTSEAILETIHDQSFKEQAYPDLALGQAKLGRFDLAVSLARLQSQDWDRVRVLMEIVSIVPKRDPDIVADKIFKEALAITIGMDPRLSSDQFFSIAATQAERGNLSGAFETLSRMPSDPSDDGAAKYKTQVKENLAYWQCKAGRKDDAVAWSGSEADPLSRTYILIGIVEASLNQDPPNTNGSTEWEIVKKK